MGECSHKATAITMVKVTPASKPNAATPQSQPEGQQSPLALRLHLHHQQLETVLENNQHPLRNPFGGPAQMQSIVG